MPAPLALIEDAPATGGRVVTLRGEIDVGSTPALRDWLSRASDEGRHSLVVDLSNVEFMAVSGLYVLCDEQARMAAHQARLTVVCPSGRILQLFDVCRLSDVMRVVRDRSELDGTGWDLEDEDRTERLMTWLSRYASGNGSGGAPASA